VVTVRVVRVFIDEHSRHGDLLGIVTDPDAAPDPERRQAIAAALGYNETVFIDDPAKAAIRIYSPSSEVPFAGPPAVGAAWMLSQLNGEAPDTLRTAIGDVATWTDQDGVWVRALLAHTPPWWHERVADAATVDALAGPQSPSQDMTQLWAWEDEPAGTMRVRSFASRVGLTEDEACGTGAMRLAAAHGRHLILHHGAGSIIHAKPGPPGYADIGGHVAEDDTRQIDEDRRT
jgi:predicted PhzF superfamily epimerase YddE/YHI9